MSLYSEIPNHIQTHDSQSQHTPATISSTSDKKLQIEGSCYYGFPDIFGVLQYKQWSLKGIFPLLRLTTSFVVGPERLLKERL